MTRQNLTLFLTLTAVFFHLGFSMSISNVFLGILVLSVFIDKRIVSKLGELLKTKLFWILISPFILFFISAFYSSNDAQAWKVIEARLPMLLVPFVFGLSPLSKKSVSIVLKFFVLLVCVIPILGFLSQIGIYLETGDSGYFYNDGLVDYTNKQAAYFALYANLALVIVFHFWFKAKDKSLSTKIGIVVVAFVLISIQYLLASRMALLVMVVVVGGFILQLILANTSKNQIVSLLLGVGLVAGILVVSFPKVIKRFDSITHTEYQFDNTNPINHFNGEIKAENWNGLNTRLALWACAWEEVKENPIFGTGVGDVQDDLVKNYQEKNFIFALKSNFNTHNQYLDILLSNGFVGLFLFFCFVLYILFSAIKNKNWMLFGIIMVFVMSCFTENILSRNQGIVLFSLITSFLIYNKYTYNDKYI